MRSWTEALSGIDAVSVPVSKWVESTSVIVAEASNSTGEPPSVKVCAPLGRLMTGASFTFVTVTAMFCRSVPPLPSLTVTCTS